MLWTKQAQSIQWTHGLFMPFAAVFQATQHTVF